MKCKVLYCPQIQPNAATLTAQHFAVQMDNDPIHTVKATRGFLNAMAESVT